MWYDQFGYGFNAGETMPPLRGTVARVAGTPSFQLGIVIHTRSPHTSKPSGKTLSGTYFLKKKITVTLIPENI